MIFHSHQTIEASNEGENYYENDDVALGLDSGISWHCLGLTDDPPWDENHKTWENFV